MKDCYCHNCKMWFHHLDIMSHRAMHRNRNESVKITYSQGDSKTHNFGNNSTPPATAEKGKNV